MTGGQSVWRDTSHLSLQVLPPGGSIDIFLEADGMKKDDVLERLEYHSERSTSASESPDLRRYRASREIYESAGLIIERNATVRLTPLGYALRRMLPDVTLSNVLLVAPYALNVLGAGQLRNPSMAGAKYDESIEVHPFQVIWRVMAGCDWRISSEELNRVVLAIPNDDEVPVAIQLIREGRRASAGRADADLDKLLGPRTDQTKSANDRMITWISLAGFGWSLIRKKDAEGYYTAEPRAIDLLARAAATPRPHFEFEDKIKYLEYLERLSGFSKN